MNGDAGANKDIRIFVVVVTHNRPKLLDRCLTAIDTQRHAAERVLVVDNASVDSVADIVLRHHSTHLIILPENRGPAAAYAIGIKAALSDGATHVWLMDDDGFAADTECLASLIDAAQDFGSDFTSPIVLNVQAPERLAFPIRRNWRTRFLLSELEPGAVLKDFAHLFNGALITAEAFRRIGFPDERLFIRGDEVEFLLRARKAGLSILTDKRARFYHPSSEPEIFPILGGLFYAVVPRERLKCFYQFRNRGWIFARYGMWGWLAADHVRYGCHYIHMGDPVGFCVWLQDTWLGVVGNVTAPVTCRPVASLGGNERSLEA